MQDVKKFLDKISAGDWERSGKNIQTRGGTFIGYASTKEDAALMTAAPTILRRLMERFPEDKELAKEIKLLLK